MAVDQIVIRFSEQGMAQLSASIDVLHTKIQGLGAIATKMSTRMPLGTYGLTSGIASQTRSDVLVLSSQMLETAKMNKSLLALHKTTQLFGREMGLQWQMSQLAKNAQAANIPLFQMSRNAARLAEVVNPLRNNLAQLRLTIGGMAINLKDTNLEGERFARMAMAAQVPAGQLSANAARLAQLRTPATLMMPSPGAQLGVSVAGLPERSMAGLSAQARMLEVLTERLRVFQGLARQPIGVFGGGGEAGLTAQANLQNAIFRTQRRIEALRERVAVVSAAKIDWKRASSVAASGLGQLNFLAEHAIGRLSYLGFIFVGLSTSLFNVTRRMAEFGATSMATQQQFETTAKMMGTTASSLLPALEKASLGVVAKFDLMKMSNFALIGGMKVNQAQIAQLAEAATKLGIVFGWDVNDAYRRLIASIVKGERRLLDELGITAAAKDAYNEYAEAIGKTTDELTRQDKVQAMANLVLGVTKEALDKLGNVDWDKLAPLQQIGKLLSDFGMEISQMFVDSGAAVDIINVLKAALADLLEFFKSDAGKKFFESITNAVQSIIPWIERLGRLLIWAAEKVDSLVKAFAGLAVGSVLKSIIPAIASFIPGAGPVMWAVRAGAALLPAAAATSGFLMGDNSGPTSMNSARELGTSLGDITNKRISQTESFVKETQRYYQNSVMQEGPIGAIAIS